MSQLIMLYSDLGADPRSSYQRMTIDDFKKILDTELSFLNWLLSHNMLRESYYPQQLTSANLDEINDMTDFLFMEHNDFNTLKSNLISGFTNNELTPLFVDDEGASVVIDFPANI